ncbi:hypothetical protein ABZ451_41395, partial [Streptomyces sp. NPDC005731]
GIERMQQLGRISTEADPARLATLLLAAFQGGTLLAQVARNITPLKDALQTAIDYLQTFATSPDDSVIAPGAGDEVHEAGGRPDHESVGGGRGQLLSR